MKTAIQMEYRKFVSTRMWWVLLIIMAAYMAFMAGAMAVAFSVSPEDVTTASGTGVADAMDPVTMAISIYTIAVGMGYVFPAIIGALSVTSEFRHKTITPSLLAEQNRTRLVAAKMVAGVPVGLVFGIVGTLSGVVTGAVILQLLGDGAHLGSPDVWKAIALSVLALTLWTVLGVGLGSLLSNQVAVIVVLLAFTQFVEPILRLALSAISGGSFARVAAYLPGAAGEAMAGASIYSSAGMGALLPAWAGALVLLGYALLTAGIGRATTFRRDFT